MPIYEIDGANADFCEEYDFFSYNKRKEIGHYEMQFAHENDFSNPVNITEPL